MIGEIDNIYDDEDKCKLIIYKKQDNLYQDFLFNCDVDTKKYIIDFFYLHYFAKEYDKKWKIRFDIKLELSKFERLIYQQQFTLYSDDLMKQSFIDDVPNIIDSYIDRNFRSNYNSSDGLYDLPHKITMARQATSTIISATGLCISFSSFFLFLSQNSVRKNGKARVEFIMELELSTRFTPHTIGL